MSIQPGNLDPKLIDSGCDCDQSCDCNTQTDNYIESVTGKNAPKTVAKSQPFDGLPDSHRQFLM